MPGPENGNERQVPIFNIGITFDPATHQVSLSSNIRDDVIMLGLLEQAKVIVVEQSRSRQAEMASRIMRVPPGMKVS